jgi:ADP-ribose pyrophosphatase
MAKTVLESNRIFDGKFVKLSLEKIMMPNNTILDKEKTEQVHRATVVPVTNDGKFVLISQYIMGNDEWRLGLIGGGIEHNGEFSNYTEKPMDAAKRELLEEAGYEANKWELLYGQKRRGTSNQDVYFYLATDLYKSSAKRHIDENEPLKVVEVKFDKALKMAFEGKFPHPSTGYMVILAAKRLGKLNEK